MARPHKEIDKTQFEKLCALQCTRDEITGWFDCSHNTLDGWCKRTYHAPFSEVYEDKRQSGKISLRRNQWKLAEKSATMAIWLGKQYLGQTDQVVVKHQEIAEDPLSAAFEALEQGNGDDV